MRPSSNVNGFVARRGSRVACRVVRIATHHAQSEFGRPSVRLRRFLASPSSIHAANPRTKVERRKGASAPAFASLENRRAGWAGRDGGDSSSVPSALLAAAGPDPMDLSGSQSPEQRCASMGGRIRERNRLSETARRPGRAILRIPRRVSACSCQGVACGSGGNRASPRRQVGERKPYGRRDISRRSRQDCLESMSLGCDNSS